MICKGNQNMNKKEFYLLIEEVINRSLTELEIELLDIVCESDSSTYSSNCILLEYVHITDMPIRVMRGSCGYWLYDRKTKVALLGLERGLHEQLMSTLYAIYTNSNYLSFEDNAEHYINQCMGFYLSGSLNMHIPIKADQCILSQNEQIFNTSKGKLSWRGI